MSTEAWRSSRRAPAAAWTACPSLSAITNRASARGSIPCGRSVREALTAVEAAEGRLDVLVHNAGILAAGAVDGPAALQAFDTNAVGIVRVTEAALPLLRKSSNATVVTVSRTNSAS